MNEKLCSTEAADKHSLVVVGASTNGGSDAGDSPFPSARERKWKLLPSRGFSIHPWEKRLEEGK